MSVAAPAVAVVSRLNPWWLQTARLLGHILRSSFPLQCTVRHAFAYDSPLKSSFVPPCLPSRSAAPPGAPIGYMRSSMTVSASWLAAMRGLFACSRATATTSATAFR
jgi:hypothetical protein